MRTRKEFEEEITNAVRVGNGRAGAMINLHQIELLLDIRDLLIKLEKKK